MLRNRTLAGVLTAITLALVIASCAVFGQVAEKIAVGVEKYCEQPYVYRSDFRNTVNAQLVGTGHVVHVHCSGDPDATPTTNIDPTDAVAGLTFTVANIEGYDYATKKESHTETVSRIGERTRETQAYAGKEKGPQENET